MDQPTRKPKYLKKIIIESKCQWCNRSFSAEKTLLAHLCEQKRRFQQKDSLHCRYGLQAFLAITSYFKKGVTVIEEDFRKSDFYLACVRWGRFVIDVKCLNPTLYLNWLIDRNIPIDKWNKDEIYICWISEIVFTEDEWDALNRSVKTMSIWADTNNTCFSEYFKSAANSRILWDISCGLISGWVVYCSESGQQWLSSISTKELESIWEVINPQRWTIKFSKMKNEKEQISSVCDEAGI